MVSLCSAFSFRAGVRLEKYFQTNNSLQFKIGSQGVTWFLFLNFACKCNWPTSATVFFCCRCNISAHTNAPDVWHSWRRVESVELRASEKRKTGVEISSQCSPAEQLPSHTAGIPSPGLLAGNSNAPAINARWSGRGKILLEPFCFSSSPYNTLMKADDNSCVVWGKNQRQKPWKTTRFLAWNYFLCSHNEAG